MAQVSSISRVGTTEPFYLQVARNQISFHKSNFKFGFNPDIDDALETVWAQGGLYSYLETATALKVSSSSLDDAVTQTGARQVEVSGLDANYDELTETIVLAGQTAVTTSNQFIRVNRMKVISAGSGGQNAGVIYAGTGTISSGVPANKYATIAIGDNQTLMCTWTVPRGYTAYLHQIDITMNTEVANKYGTVSLVAKPLGGVFNVQDKFALSQDIIHKTFTYPRKYEEKTDIEVRAIASSSNADLAVSAGLDIIYIQNDGA